MNSSRSRDSLSRSFCPKSKENLWALSFLSIREALNAGEVFKREKIDILLIPQKESDCGILLRNEPGEYQKVCRKPRLEGKLAKRNRVFEVTITKKGVAKPKRKLLKRAVFITGNEIGAGDKRLNKLLMRLFLQTLTELPEKVNFLIFMNNGVKLTVEGSEVLEILKGIESLGTEIMVCGTCLDFYKLKERLKVGRVTNIYEITERLLSSAVILRI